jgi:hypothetical protein
MQNAGRLFGEQLAAASVPLALQRFAVLQEEAEAKALGAELELAMRAIYYADEAASPSTVGRLRQELCSQLSSSTADLRFLLAHARALLPASIRQLQPSAVLPALSALRGKLRADREAAIGSLCKALAAFYPERESREAEALARACAALLAKADDLRALAADAAELFPAEFASAKAKKVVKAFKEAQGEKLGSA